MTNEQKESLSRVRATYAYANNSEAFGGSYHTEDVRNVLELLEESNQKLKSIKEDLIDLKEYVTSNSEFTEEVPLFVSLLDSVLHFINEE